MLGMFISSMRSTQQNPGPIKAIKQNPRDAMNCRQLPGIFVPLSFHSMCRRRREETNQNESPSARRNRCGEKYPESKMHRRFDGVNLVRDSRQWSQEYCNDSLALVAGSHVVKHTLGDERNL